MTHVTYRLTAKNRDQLRNPSLGNRVWATFTFISGGRGGGRVAGTPHRRRALIALSTDSCGVRDAFRFNGQLEQFVERASVSPLPSCVAEAALKIPAMLFLLLVVLDHCGSAKCLFAEKMLDRPAQRHNNRKHRYKRTKQKRVRVRLSKK